MADNFDDLFAGGDKFDDLFSGKPARPPAAPMPTLADVGITAPADPYSPAATSQQAADTLMPLPGLLGASIGQIEMQQRAKAQADAEAAAFQQAAIDNPATLLDLGRAYSGSVLTGIGHGVDFGGRMYSRAQDGLAGLFGLDPGVDLSNLGGGLREMGEVVRGGYNEGFIQELQNNEWGVERDAMGNPVGSELNPANWTLGKDPSLIGAAGRTADIAGSLVPVIGAGALSGGATVPAIVGGLMGGGSNANQVEAEIDRMWAEGRMADSQEYVDLVRGGMAPEDAYAQVRLQAGDMGGLLGGSVAAAGGAITGKLVSPATNLFPKLSRLIGVPATLAVASGTESAQEGAEQVATNVGRNIAAGTDGDVTEGVAGNMIGGLVGGKATGVLAAYNAAQGDPALARAYATAMDDKAPVADRMAALMDLNARGYTVPETAFKPADPNAEPAHGAGAQSSVPMVARDMERTDTANELVRTTAPRPLVPESVPAARQQPVTTRTELGTTTAPAATQYAQPAPTLTEYNGRPIQGGSPEAPTEERPAAAAQDGFTDLFPAPTQGEQIRAAAEAKDDARNGRTGQTGGSWFGTGLGAGSAPAQADIEGETQAEPQIPREQIADDNARAAMELGLDAEGRPAPEPDFTAEAAEPDGFKRQFRQVKVPNKNGGFTTMNEPILDYSHDNLLHFLAAAGGVNVAAIAAEASQGVTYDKRGNPIYKLDFMKDKANLPFGRVNMPAVRREGGMNRQQLWEKLREGGWFVDETADGNADGDNQSAYTNDESAAAQMVYEAIQGEPIFHPTEGQDARLSREIARRREDDLAAAERDWNARTYEQAEAAEVTRRLREEHQVEIAEADAQEAASLAELVTRALDAGADPASLAQAQDEQTSAYAARLWQQINGGARGTDSRAAEQGDPGRGQGAPGRQAAGDAAATPGARNANAGQRAEAGAADAEVGLSADTQELVEYILSAQQGDASVIPPGERDAFIAAMEAGGYVADPGNGNAGRKMPTWHSDAGSFWLRSQGPGNSIIVQWDLTEQDDPRGYEYRPGMDEAAYRAQFSGNIGFDTVPVSKDSDRLGPNYVADMLRHLFGDAIQGTITTVEFDGGNVRALAEEDINRKAYVLVDFRNVPKGVGGKLKMRAMDEGVFWGLPLDYDAGSREFAAASLRAALDYAAENGIEIETDKPLPTIKAITASGRPGTKPAKMKYDAQALIDEVLAEYELVEPGEDADDGVDALRRKKPRKSKRNRQPLSESRGDAGYSPELSLFTGNGYTEEMVANMPPSQQIKVASRIFGDVFGFKTVTVAPDLNIIEAMNQFKFGYSSMQSLAYVLAWPNATYGNIVKNLALEKNPKGAPGALAYYSPSENKIVLTRQNDAFAHEFAHGLDYWTWRTLGYTDPQSGEPRGRGATGKLRMGGELTQPSVENAYHNLLRTMYQGQGDAAFKIAGIEKHILVINKMISDKQAKAAATPSDDTRAKLEEQIRKHQAHVARLVKQIQAITKNPAASYTGDTDYYLNSRMLDKKGGTEAPDGGYWQRPTEMFARAFEAWVANKVEAHGAASEFLGRSDEGYQEAVDFIQKAYPQLIEREKIFLAIDDLMDAIRDEAMRGVRGPLAQLRLPEAFAAHDLSNLTPETKPLEVVSAIKHAIALAATDRQNTREAHAKMGARLAAARDARNPTDSYVRDLWLRNVDMSIDVRAGFAGTMSGFLHGMTRRYPKSGVMRELASMLTTDPGSGRVRGETYEAWMGAQRAKWGNKLAGIVAHFDLMNGKAWSKAELRELRDFMVDDRESGDRPAYSEKVKQAGDKLRAFHNEMHGFMANVLDKKGIDLGYTKNGYLHRVMDESLVADDPAGFVAAATKVYAEVFEKEVSPLDEPDLAKLIQAINDVAAINVTDPDVRELRKLMRDLKRAEESGDQDAADVASQQIEDLLRDGLYEKIQMAWANEASHDWMARILGTAEPDHVGVQTAGGSFMKTRTLPPSADRLLGDFMVTDVVSLSSTYLTAVVNRATFEHFIPGEGPAVKRLAAYTARMQAEGVALADIEETMKVLETVTGLYRTNITRRGRYRMSGLVSTYLPVVLARSLFAQMAEPITIGMRTGNWGDIAVSVKHMVEDLAGWLPTHLILPKSAKARAARRREMAEFWGAVTNAHFDHMLSARNNIMVGSNASERKIANFFKYNGVHAHAMSMRRAAVERSMVYFQRIAKKAIKGSRLAVRDLGDLGLSMVRDAKLIEFLANGMGVTASKQTIIDSGYQAKLTVMVNRFVDEAIMNPKKIDKPRAASAEWGHIYAVMSFTSAFQNNVVKRQGKRLAAAIEEAQGKPAKVATGILEAANTGSFIAVFMAAQAAQYFFRVAAVGGAVGLIGGGGFDDTEKKLRKMIQGYKDEPMLGLLHMMSRSGYTGLADMPINAILGLKYRRQLSSMLTGAYGAAPAQAFEKIAAAFTSNSDKNNNAERAAIEAAWTGIVSPVIAHQILTRTPFATPSLMLLTSADAGSRVADVLVGPKSEKGADGQQTGDNQNRDTRRRRVRRQREGGGT